MKKIIAMAVLAGVFIIVRLGNEEPAPVQDAEASISDSYINVINKAEAVSTVVQDAEVARRSQLDDT
jgi:hypothetical protein